MNLPASRAGIPVAEDIENSCPQPVVSDAFVIYTISDCQKSSFMQNNYIPNLIIPVVFSAKITQFTEMRWRPPKGKSWLCHSVTTNNMSNKSKQLPKVNSTQLNSTGNYGHRLAK